MSSTREVALVTGGASGIGREICIELSQQGVLVVVADVDKAGANDTLQQLTGVGSQLLQGTAAKSTRWLVPLFILTYILRF
jgi:NAD(P)-dependent dehydrogenase (short-subunit alcohol dehydrogenase family)